MVHTELQHLHSEDIDSVGMCRYIETGSAQIQYMILQKLVLVLTHDQNRLQLSLKIKFSGIYMYLYVLHASVFCEIHTIAYH